MESFPVGLDPVQDGGNVFICSHCDRVDDSERSVC